MAVKGTVHCFFAGEAPPGLVQSGDELDSRQRFSRVRGAETQEVRALCESGQDDNFLIKPLEGEANLFTSSADVSGSFFCYRRGHSRVNQAPTDIFFCYPYFSQVSM